MFIDNSNQDIIYYQLDAQFSQEQVMFITNATIEEIQESRQATYVTISYVEDWERRRRQTIVLIVNRATRIQRLDGSVVPVNQLRVGTRINALISTRMTMSMPPQSVAFIIIVLDRDQRRQTIEGRIVSINRRQNQLVIRTRDGRRNQGRMRFFVSRSTRITNRRGQRIRLEDLNENDQVFIEYEVVREPGRQPINVAISIQRI